MTEPTVTDTMGHETAVPEHIIERTANLLGETPMTNQRVILDTADWYLENAGNCPIYRWCIHHLDTLEHDEVMPRVDVYSDARKQANEMGLDV
jgi:hypothetical protein